MTTLHGIYVAALSAGATIAATAFILQIRKPRALLYAALSLAGFALLALTG